jgi:hypothetical protein
VGPGAVAAGEESQVPVVSAEDVVAAEAVGVGAIGVGAMDEVDEGSRMLAVEDGNSVIESSVVDSPVLNSPVQ